LEAKILEPKAPTQKRGHERISLIQEKALALLEKHEIHQISISELAKSSGVGVGTFYHYYPSKEALLLDLRATFLQETAASLASNFQQPVANRTAFLELFKGLLNQWLQALIKVKNLERAVWSYAFKNPEFSEALKAQDVGLNQMVVSILENYRPYLREANLEIVAQSLVMWVDGTMSRILRNEALIEDHQWLVRELTRMMGHYLFPDVEKS